MKVQTTNLLNLAAIVSPDYGYGGAAKSLNDTTPIIKRIRLSVGP